MGIIKVQKFVNIFKLKNVLWLVFIDEYKQPLMSRNAKIK